MTRDERDRFAELFHNLVHIDPVDPRVEADPELRVLSHALLNYLGSRASDDANQGPLSAPTAAGTARASEDIVRALPWLSAFLDWSRADHNTAHLAERLANSSAFKTLSAPMIAARLDAAPSGPAQTAPGALNGVPGTPQTPPGGDFQVTALCRLARAEMRLAALIELPEAALRDRLIDDTALLAVAAELCESGAQNALTDRLAEAIAPWRRPAGEPGAGRNHPALHILAGLHDAPHAPDPMAAPGVELARRSRRFEHGLAQNMARVGLIGAVRAALAFSTPSHASDSATTGRHATPGRDHARCALDTREARETFLGQFGLFRTDHALLELASALIEIRGLCLDYLRGAAPLASLSPWIDYLRGGCVELAEARQCTLREAMSYAHYCLHLLNICDLTAGAFDSIARLGVDGWALTEEIREAMCLLEDELKEFALLGQREGLSDAQADLGRFERARWRREGDAAFLADRLSRLRGAWRKGIIAGPVGAPPRLDPDTTAHSRAVIDSQLSGADEADIAALAGVAAHAQLRDCEWLELLSPAQILKLIATCASAARDLPGVDIGERFVVDLGPLGRWARDAHRGRLNRRILAMLLDRRSVADILNAQVELGALSRGLVGHTRTADGRIIALADPSNPSAPPAVQPGADQGYLVMDFGADAELRALLELMCASTADDPQFQGLLERRLRDMLGRDEPESAQVAGDSPDETPDDLDTHDPTDHLSPPPSGLN